MTTPNEGNEHTHDGVVEVNIPPWLVWTVAGIAVGVGVWIAVDVWQQRRIRKLVKTDSAHTVHLRNELRLRAAEELAEQKQTFAEQNGHVPVEVKADESPAV